VAERLVLVGMMGAGKSAVGALAAAALRRRFVDVDAEVEQRCGSSIAALFATEGEAAFRRLESDLLAESVADESDAVIAVGGGAVLDRANRARIVAAGTVVWLRARPGTLAERVGDGDERPLLGGAGPGGVARRLAELAEQRAPLYEEVADAVVDVDDRSMEAVVADVVAVARAGAEAAS
jgi:shikimate kinase